MWILGLLSVLLVAGLLIMMIGGLRRGIFTTVLFHWFKSVLPPMSQTEKEAIEAGDVWHEANLFQGKPRWSDLLANPKPTLTLDEKKFLDNQVEVLCGMLDDWKITQQDYNLEPAAWDYIKSSGFFAFHIPKQFGGLEFSSLASSTIVQKIASKSASAAVTVMVPNSLGPAELLLRYGTTAQKQKYLQRLAKGLEIPCFALTAPEAGSDAGSITDEGIVSRGDFGDEKNVLGLTLNWSKRYITLAPVATLIGLAVKVKDPEKLLGENADLGITVVLVPHNLPGIDIGKRHFPLNQTFMNGPIRGNNVFVTLDYIVGGKAMIGKGWLMLMECLAAGRGVSLPALSTATGKHCYRTTGAYAKVRQQFNLSIGKFEGVASAMARIGGYTYMLEATRLLTLGALDQHIRPSVITAMCKYHMTEMARKAINDAMDIHGGRGIMLGPLNYLARTYESIPVSITVEGANILTRCLIIFGQGAIRCHPYVLKEIQAVNNPDYQQALKLFDQAIWAHFGYTVCNFTKLSWHSLTDAIFCSSPQATNWDRYYKKFSFLSLALACCADIAMLFLGGNLKRKENLSARLGDVMGYLYIASAVLKYDHDHQQQDADQIFVQWCLQYCLANIQQSFVDFLDNFPNKLIAKPLQWMIFPPWRTYKMPSDDLSLKLSAAMMQPSEFRERITQYTVPVSKLEETWLKMIEVEPLLTKIEMAVKQGIIVKSSKMADKIQAAVINKIISDKEASILLNFEKMRLDIIQVDEFTNAELIGNKV